MYVSVVFVMRYLYSAVSLTLIREQRFIRIIIITIIIIIILKFKNENFGQLWIVTSGDRNLCLRSTHFTKREKQQQQNKKEQNKQAKTNRKAIITYIVSVPPPCYRSST